MYKRHNSTKRNYINRMLDQKIICMKESKKYSKNYWDGDRRYGYGGYYFIEGYWLDLAKKFIKDYWLWKRIFAL